MRYYLTGATGFIGGHITRQLLGAGHEVVALVRTPERARDLKELGVRLVEGDITEPETLAGTMEGVDGVFHVAAWYKVGVRNRDRAFAINVDGTRNVLTAAREAGVPKIVYTSTLAVYGDTAGTPVDESYRMHGPWLSLYDQTKWLAHYEVAVPMMEDGLPAVIVQPGLVHGPGDHSNLGDVLRDYLQGRLPVIPKQGGCWSYVEDIARGHILAMEVGRPGEAYNLAGPCRTWAEVFPVLEDITGVKPPRLVLPAWAARIASWLMKPVNAVVPLPRNYHPETLRIAGGATYYAKDAKAREELGWSPRPLRDGLEITLTALMDELGVEPPRS
ncbi:MAG: NAD-dependent epimerase/dehydratase family protein [Longimicrobiales bacterium]|nr:NAD-dependent epimerase/dehydratase family protein [Longimicrobiales bacterium]